MLRVDDIERLSRFRSGELSEVEAAQVRAQLLQEPELARALRRLERLDALSSEVAAAAAPVPSADLAVARAVRASAVPPAWRGWALAAAALAAVAITYSLFRPVAPALVETATQRERIAGEVVESPSGRALLFEGAQVERDGDALVLRAGTALVEGKKVPLRCDGHALEIDGRALVSLEPAAAVLHVTGATEPNPHGDDMQRLKAQWLAQPPSTAGMAVLLAVLSGTAHAGDASALLPGGVWLGQTRVQNTGTRTVPSQVAPAAKPGPAVVEAPRAPTARKVMLAEGMIPYQPLADSLMRVGPALAKCFEAGRAVSSKMEGDVTLAVTIVPRGVGGRAEDVQVEGYTLQNPFVTSCVVQAVLALEFPAPTTPKAKIYVPIEFEVRGEPGSEGVGVVIPSIEGQPNNMATSHMPDRVSRVDVRTPSAVSVGANAAPVTMVAFLDFECTFCQRSWTVLAQLMAQYEGKVRFVFMGHPLPFHKGARMAAEASMAAHQQGRFMEYATLLFAEQTMHDPAGLDALARRAGLDLQRFRQGIEDGSASRAVEAQLAEAERLGSKGTPSFFINGKEVIGARPLETFQKMIDAELAARP